MLDDYTTRGMIVRAALRLAEQKGWRRLGLDDIAREAGLALADVRAEFDSKGAILEAFMQEVDRAVLKASDPDPDEPARDRIFDVLMTRFEVLAPYKAALRRIAREAQYRPGSMAYLTCLSLRSQYWMLLAAGIGVDAPGASLKVPGLLAVYGRAAAVWLDDDDPGHGRTMAALDRELRRGERWLTRLDTFGADAIRLACRFVPRRRRPRADEGPVVQPVPGPTAEEPRAG
ncbi:MAG: TetR/AcrR family transcriptional regulator [Hyphomicrobiales bacterium]|nr:TetR/AcrR family transcriptional regulator [Hyphomicrobiales bacterium]